MVTLVVLEKKDCCHFLRLTLIQILSRDLGRQQMIHSDRVIGESVVKDRQR